MLPPPTTSAIWQPTSWACFTSRAICSTSSMPIPRSPACDRLSPESLRMTRLKAGRGVSAVAMKSSSRLAPASTRGNDKHPRRVDAAAKLFLPQNPMYKLFDFHLVPIGIDGDGLCVFLDERLLVEDLLGVKVLEP